MAKSNDKKFNETLQRMLKTPPSHHEDEKKGEKKPTGSMEHKGSQKGAKRKKKSK